MSQGSKARWKALVLLVVMESHGEQRSILPETNKDLNLEASKSLKEGTA